MLHLLGRRLNISVGIPGLGNIYVEIHVWEPTT